MSLGVLDASVLSFGDRVKTLTRLDSFVANAGIDTTHFERFEGHESIWTVNVISTFLISMLIVPKLRETSKLQRKPGRLAVVGSVGHIFCDHQQPVEPELGQIFRSLDDEKTADMEDRYHLTKLIVFLCVRKLAGKLSATEKGKGDVIVNFVHPGWCKTDLSRTRSGGFGKQMGLRLIGRSAKDGGKALAHGAVAGEETYEKYFDMCCVKSESAWVRSEDSIEVERRVWPELVDILEGIRPGVTRL